MSESKLNCLGKKRFQISTAAPKSNTYLDHELKRAAGVKRMRVHHLRHSNVPLLIVMGFSALAIVIRIGHESVDITHRYAHLFPRS